MLSARNISALAVSPSGQLWIGYFDRGLDIVSKNLHQARHIENDHIFCVNRIVPDPTRGSIDVATANGLVFLDDLGHQRQVMARNAGLISPDVTDLALYPSGMTLATPAGITFLDNTGAHSIYAFQGLINNHVYALGLHSGELLAGTLGGVSILHNDAVTLNLNSSTSGLLQNWITAMVPDHKGWLIGTYGHGVQRLNSANRFSNTAATLPNVDVNPNAMLATPNLVLAGTLHHGLFVLNRSTGRWRNILHGLPSRNVTAFAVSGSTLYIGTSNGLVSTTEQGLEE
jgi:ligand-binding sensor domain-containing protein